MKTKRSHATKSKTTFYKISPAERIEILWKSIEKNGGEYDFYDIKYGEVIIKGASLVDGKNGVFLGMPSVERNGEYYPTCYIARALNERLCGYIEDADNNDDWIEVTDDDEKYLSFDADKGNAKTKSKKKTKAKETSDDSEDD